MSFRVRPATGEDFARHLRNGQADRRRVHQSARRTATTLVAKLARSEKSFSRDGGQPGRRPLRLRSRRPEGQASSAAPARCSAQVGVASPSTLPSEHADPDQPGARQDLPQPDADADHRPRRIVGSRRSVPPSRDARAGGWGALARAQPLSVHQAAPRPLRRPHRSPSFAE